METRRSSDVSQIVSRPGGSTRVCPPVPRLFCALDFMVIMDFFSYKNVVPNYFEPGILRTVSYSCIPRTGVHCCQVPLSGNRAGVLHLQLATVYSRLVQFVSKI